MLNLVCNMLYLHIIAYSHSYGSKFGSGSLNIPFITIVGNYTISDTRNHSFRWLQFCFV